MMILRGHHASMPNYDATTQMDSAGISSSSPVFMMIALFAPSLVLSLGEGELDEGEMVAC
jgi:hypothetical protein